MTVESILLTGASGYVGGTLLTSITSGEHAWTKGLNISALARSEAQAAAVRATGIKPVQIASYDGLEEWASIAKDYDIVIHAAAGWNVQVSQAIILGLGQRKRETQRKVHFFGISGVTNIADRPLTGVTDTSTLSDREDIYTYMKHRQSVQAYPPREHDLTVVEKGLEYGVETYVIMAPHIFGIGTGPFNRFTFPVNMIMNGAKAHGKGFVIGDGSGVWSHVHIQDLVDLYLILLKHVLNGDEIPSGRKGIYFAESGVNSQLEMSQKVAEAGKALGMLPTDEVEHVDLETAAKLFGGWGPSVAELAGASNARIDSAVGRSLGWKPQREGDWEGTIRLELEEFEKNPPPARDMTSLSSVVGH